MLVGGALALSACCVTRYAGRETLFALSVIFQDFFAYFLPVNVSGIVSRNDRNK